MKSFVRVDTDGEEWKMASILLEEGDMVTSITDWQPYFLSKEDEGQYIIKQHRWEAAKNKTWIVTLNGESYYLDVEKAKGKDPLQAEMFAPVPRGYEHKQNVEWFGEDDGQYRFVETMPSASGIYTSMLEALRTSYSDSQGTPQSTQPDE